MWAGYRNQIQQWRRRGLGMQLPEVYSEKVKRICGNSLIAHWPLSERSGTTAFDLSTEGNNGTYVNILPGTVEGIGDGRRATTFDGIADRVDIFSIASDFDVGEITLKQWLKAKNLAMWTNGLASKGIYIAADADNRIQIGKGAADNTMFVHYEAGNITQSVIIPTSTIDWFSIAITASVINDEVKAFFNGVQIGATLTGLGTWVGALLSTTVNIGAFQAGTNHWLGDSVHTLVCDIALSSQNMADLAVV